MEKLIIASDLHGSGFWTEKLINLIETTQPTKILLLGDLLYHGPRNPLPDGHNPMKVVELLAKYQDKIVGVRGNCDAEIDQTVLPFFMFADFQKFSFDGVRFFLTHGHLYSPENPPRLKKNEVLFCGHFHVPCHFPVKNGVYLNCGSVALPKDNSPHSAVVYENKTFTWVDLSSMQPFDSFSL